eukprot:gnl/MRDRNA2_/MRDRNA2_34040_c0_seq1.p1 gnl/MRDRNA2_/MRDRNA2_34040_c0~~gnl/MRDRNA2_/MRDRNA2_34040_c0_seq1.p1  ORF type:complete len:629 (-),score=68.06 gnl/MRDRNA2_/MRDRNA2_34040_c0_seq1:193-2079(-)
MVKQRSRRNLRDGLSLRGRMVGVCRMESMNLPDNIYPNGLNGAGKFMSGKAMQVVFFQAGMIAVISCIASVAIKWSVMDNPDNLPEGLLPSDSVVYTSLSGVLGILLVFRTAQAYSRYWEAAHGLHRMSIEYFDACAQVCSFAQRSGSCQERIDIFQLSMIRLFSLLHGVSVQRVAESSYENIKAIDQGGLDDNQVQFLSGQSHKIRPDIVMQWVLGTVTEAVQTDIIKVPAPIVSRVYQELNSGMVELAQISTVADIPFPIPYAHMAWGLLVVHFIMTPFYAASFTVSRPWAGLFGFASVFSVWCIQFIGVELEQPFGDDRDDLDLAGSQEEFNKLLMVLLEPEMQWIPSLDAAKTPHEAKKISISADADDIYAQPDDIDGIKTSVASPSSCKSGQTASIRLASEEFNEVQSQRPSVARADQPSPAEPNTFSTGQCQPSLAKTLLSSQATAAQAKPSQNSVPRIGIPSEYSRGERGEAPFKITLCEAVADAMYEEGTVRNNLTWVPDSGPLMEEACGGGKSQQGGQNQAIHQSAPCTGSIPALTPSQHAQAYQMLLRRTKNTQSMPCLPEITSMGNQSASLLHPSLPRPLCLPPEPLIIQEVPLMPPAASILQQVRNNVSGSMNACR